MKKKKGFTLIEILITMVILIILIVGVMGSLNWFSFFSEDRLINTCLVEGASSGIMACRGGEYISNITCGNYTINVQIVGNCTPAYGNCSEVVVTATYNTKSFTLNDTVCNF